MYTRYLHRKRGARYLCSPSPPLERTHLGGVVNSASEGGRRTDISAFFPRSLESHFNARIDAWNAPSCPFFPFFLPSPSPRLENPWDDHHPPSFHQETLFLGKRKIRKGVDLSSPRDLLSSPSRERIRKKRDTTTLISSIRRVIVMQRVRQGPLTVTRDISISFDSMPRLSLRRHRRSEIVKRWELARGGVVARFTASLRKAVTRDSLNKAKNTGRADKPCRFTNIARPLTTVANHLLLREREGRRFPPSVSKRGREEVRLQPRIRKAGI